MSQAQIRSLALTHLPALLGGVLMFLILIHHATQHYLDLELSRGAPESAFKAQLDKRVPQLLRHFNIPGVVIATVVDGAPAKTYAYGYADVAQRRPMSADTVFRVASISKSLTAWGVLRLVQDGKLDLDQPAGRYLTRWPLPPSTFAASQVTIRRLLNHTSGLDAGADSFLTPDQPLPTAVDLLGREGPGPGARPGAARLLAQPGQTFVYSVPGYTLLQALIEHESGQPFADYMKRTVLEPLGMQSSSFRWDAGLRDRTATSYGDDGRPLPLTVPEDSAADGLFATAADIAKFVAAPLPDPREPAGAGVLNPSLVNTFYDEPKQMPSLQLSSLGIDTPGLGCFVEQTPGYPTIITNVGLDPGWAGQYFLSPTTGDGIVILSNSDLSQPAIAQITSIWSSWRGMPPSRLTGVYRKIAQLTIECLSLLFAVELAFATTLVADLISGERRWTALNRLSPISDSLLDFTFVLSMTGLSIVGTPLLRTMPTLSATGGVLLIGLAVVVTLRALAPARRVARAPRRRTILAAPFRFFPRPAT